MIKIKSYKAGKGDAFLVSVGENQEHNIMIDMGMPVTYEECIKEDLEKMAKDGKKIDLLVISHMHRDHIGGALEFIKDNGNKQDIIKVEEVWHNSYRHLHFDNIGEEDDKLTINYLKQIIKQNRNTYKADGINKISAEEGTSFAGNLLQYKYNWNTSFKEKAVSINTCIPQNISDDISIIVLSPNPKKLNKMAKEWVKELKGKKLSKNDIFDDAFEFYMQNDPRLDSEISKISANKNYEKLAIEDKLPKDKSITNGSSIAFIIEYKKEEENKKLLFLADAHEDIIYENLNLLKEGGYKLDFELVKVSHHAGLENTSNRLIDLIESKRFLISTNSDSAKHPHIKVLSKIITKKTNYTKEIIFNYKDIKMLETLKKDSDNLRDKYNIVVNYKEEIVV